MEKKVLYKAIISIGLGVAFIIVSFLFEFPNESFLWGFGGGGIGSGTMMLFKYLRWSKPENQKEYTHIIKKQTIELSDERKVMIREKSASITGIIMLGIYCFFIIFFAILNTLGYFAQISQYLVIGLSLLALIQLISGVIAFNYLNKRL